MAQNAIRPHIETIVSSYLNTVKNADKAALEKPFIIENDAEFIHNVEQLIASSYMLGIYHADEETGKNVNAADTDIPPIPFTEAVNFLKEKVPMTKEAWSSLEPKMRFRAFTVAKLGSAKTIDVARQQLIGALEDGSGYAETWQRIKDTLQDEAKSLTPGYWENVFRTNTQSAYIAGKLEQYEKNGVAAYQLMVIEDDRTSKICRNLLNNATGYGLILPANHQFWKTYGFPPYHYQCRTSISGLKKSQLGKDGNNVDNISMKELRRRKFKPMDGFGGNPNFWGITNSQIEQAEMYGIKEEIVEKIKITIPDEYKDFNFIKEIKENDLFDFLEDYNKASKVARDFIFKYGKQMNMDCYINGRGYYNPNDRKIYFSLNNLDSRSTLSGFKKNMTTFFHEYGHWLDYNYSISGTLRDELPMLRELLTNDAITYTNNIINDEKIKIKSFLRNSKLEKEKMDIVSSEIWKNSSTNSSISDIFEGITRGKIRDGYGHGSSYWERSFALEKEAIAEMFEAIASGGDRRKAMEKYFPSAFKYFEDKIKELLK